MHAQTIEAPDQKLRVLIEQLDGIARRRMIEEHTFRNVLRHIVRLLGYRIGAVHKFLTRVGEETGMDPRDLRSLAADAPTDFQPWHSGRMHGSAARVAMPPSKMRRAVLRSAHAYLKARYA